MLVSLDDQQAVEAIFEAVPVGALGHASAPESLLHHKGLVEVAPRVSVLLGRQVDGANEIQAASRVRVDPLQGLSPLQRS